MSKNKETDFNWCKDLISNCKTEIAKRVVGQEEVVDGILTARVAGGQILLEGVCPLKSREGCTCCLCIS